MKKIEAIIQSFNLDEVKETLKGIGTGCIGPLRWIAYGILRE